MVPRRSWSHKTQDECFPCCKEGHTLVIHLLLQQEVKWVSVEQIKFWKSLTHLWAPLFRSYLEDRIYLNDRLQLFPNGTSVIHVPNVNDTKDLISTHLAVIGDYVASCITLVSPNRVPAGNEYHVSHYHWYLCPGLYQLLLQPGMYLNGAKTNGFEVFVHNDKEEYILLY